MDLKVKTTESKRVETLAVFADVRHWEDATVNGIEDTDGSRIPCRNGSNWEPLIRLSDGVITNWKNGAVADVHYKVCDAGLYRLLDAEGRKVAERDYYVPSMLSPGGDGFGDYIIMKIDGSGKIEGFRACLDYFENNE